MRQLLEELRRLLHDGEVGGPVGVKYIVEAGDLQRSGETLHGRLLRGETEALAPGRTNRRCDLCDHDLIRILERVEDVVGVIPLTQCRGRAVGDTLTAECALAGLEIIGILHIDGTLGTGVDDIPDMAVLHLITDLYAAHALDALVVIPDQREVQRAAMFLRQLLLKRDAQDI